MRTIYEISGFVNFAWPLLVIFTNICDSFRMAGIWSYDSYAFTDEDYAPSFVTDGPQPPFSVGGCNQWTRFIGHSAMAPFSRINLDGPQETSLQSALSDALERLCSYRPEQIRLIIT